MPARPRTVRPPGSKPRKKSLSSIDRRTRSYKGIRNRFRILERDNFKCRKCNWFFPESKLEVDHIIPLSQGGPDTDENKQTLCVNCHAEKTRHEQNRFNFT